MKTIQFECPTFYSDFDETLFFMWLQSIEFVDDCHGRGANLIVEIDPTAYSLLAIRSLTALCRRYQVDEASVTEQVLAIIQPVSREA